jgi:hypothetical protein
MTISEAFPGVIKQIQTVRNPVTENTLSDPSLITDNDCNEFISKREKGWVVKSTVTSSVFQLLTYNAIIFGHFFVCTEFEKSGIGRRLHDIMLDWYFSQTNGKVWLSTSPNKSRDFFIEDPLGLKLELIEKTKSISK